MNSTKKLISFIALLLITAAIIILWQWNYQYHELSKEDIKKIEDKHYKDTDELTRQIAQLDNQQIASSITTSIVAGEKELPLVILSSFSGESSDASYKSFIYLIPDDKGYKADVRKNGIRFSPDMKPVLDEFKFNNYIIKSYLGQKSDNLIGEGQLVMYDGKDLEFVVYPEKVISK
ncbi:hypothetical protein ETI09_06840 [Macrococcoides canis]|uniref:hypothetical protein n=1 Tax=Macrococcoides canis TaxID=1855823 RepID=UPI0010601A4D|nr:hypothetical protein [Macrococcus canis]TDM41161.1 hypothetical protein ETI09_06840 [Macrococcus canis]